jgi:hypothetical protein
VSTPPEREQNWYPVSQVGWFTAHIQEGIAVTGHHPTAADRERALDLLPYDR